MSSFKLYFAGGESPEWRKVLATAGVRNIGISFSNLKPRLPKTKRYRLYDKPEFDDEGISIFLDSGGFAANKRIKTEEAARQYFDLYSHFVTDNIDRLDLVTELDLVSFPDLVGEWRRDFWAEIPADKFMPIWHTQYGASELEALASEYQNLAVVSDAQLRSKLNSLVSRHGVSLHATVTKAEDVIGVRYSSAMSSSWTSPMRYGETHIWDGRTLRKFPTAYKDRRRAQHKRVIERAGFDPRKIAKDDYDEVTRFTIWSWQQLEAAVARRRDPKGEKSKVVDITDGKRERSNGKRVDHPVDTKAAEGSRSQLIPRASKTLLPVMGQETQQGTKDEDGSSVEFQAPVSTRGSVRVCDTCYIQHNCPAMRPGHECAFELPTRIRSKDELIATLMWMFEVQAGRVAFAQYVEEKEGGYPDKNLSDEMDRFFRMAEKLEDIKSQKTTLDIKYRSGEGGGGLLTQLFGQAVGERARELPQPMDEHEAQEFSRDFLDVDASEGPILNGDE